ncbi:MAG: DNA mismatch repair protein MutS [Firmicutes bacterium]|nr:DNA mismatch repair protein MutS [Bacillota bacterium]
MGRRLANKKTRMETGFDYVLSELELGTPFGKKEIKEKQPFFPGQEEALRRELDKIGEMIQLSEGCSRSIDILKETFMEMKDNSFTIERSKTSVLSVVEIFEIKSLLLQMKKIRELFRDTGLPVEFVLEDTDSLLGALDPRGDGLNTFYIYDEFSQKLGEMRKEKRNIELSIRRENKAKKQEIKEKYGIILNPKFEFTVSKANDESIKMIHEIADLQQMEEDYTSVTFTLKKTERIYAFLSEMESLNQQIEEEEDAVREELSRVIGTYEQVLSENCRRLGELDITLSKALYAKKHKCVKPEITDRHKIEIWEGRHLKVEDALLSKGKSYCPVSITLEDGVTCITGANMGGKTVSLKLVGLIAMLTQYGLFVPADRAQVGLSNYMQILIGDSQSVERGLSSFGSEMEELKEILDNSKERSLLLIDEIASGTNPVEGLALTRSLVDYLKARSYISLITTHFETVTEDPEVRNMQVRGLAGADFDLLDREIRYASRKERIDIISKYMDYRLKQVEDQSEIPKDALNIAKMLGIGSDIINRAKDYMK